MTLSSRLPSTRPVTRRARIERDKNLKSRNNIFLNGNSPNKFQFNDRVAEVFDDVMERSVPLYHECQALTVEWCKRLAKSDTCIYDLGCSTGSLLLPLAGTVSDISGLRLIGVDNSKAMLDKAHERLEHFSNSIELVEANLVKSFSFDAACAVVMNYTLQFIPKEKRESLQEKGG